MTLVFPVDDPSRVAGIRRAAKTLAQQEGLDERLVGNVAIIVTEICTNLLNHATGGEVFLNPLANRAEPGIEILAIDRGPGMADVTQCLADGYSSVKTSGNGLGAIARLSTELDIYSQVGKGTVLVARLRRPGAARTSIGFVLKPMAGEEASGDAWAFHKTKQSTALMVADGLGHGVMAELASTEAVSVFASSTDFSPSSLLQRVHGVLHSTRGAAVAVACVDHESASVKYAGVGNIAGVLIGAGKPVQMVSHNGTAGHEFPRLQEFTYPLEDETLLVMHSDGIQSLWNLDAYPGLRRRDPSLIAGVLYRDSARQRDDMCVVVCRLGGAQS